MRTTKVLTVLLLTIAVTACATHEEHRPPPPDLTLSQNFIPHAASSGEFEVISSKLALHRSHNPVVRRVARRMINDHMTSNHELAAVLKSQGMEPPPKGLMPHQQRSLNILKDASDFDQQYLETQEVAHRQAIRLFEIYSQNGDNDQLRAFAEKTLPTLQQHYDMIGKARGDLD